MDIPSTLNAFHHYLKFQELTISRAEFEKNLNEKKISPPFIDDIPPLLRTDIISRWNPEEALETIYSKVIAHLPGDPLKV